MPSRPYVSIIAILEVEPTYPREEHDQLIMQVRIGLIMLDKLIKQTRNQQNHNALIPVLFSFLLGSVDL